MNLQGALDELVANGIIPVLHHTPIRPEFVADEDPYDPEPRWCIHDERDEMFHCHGYTAMDAAADMLEWVHDGRRPDPERMTKK